MNASKILIICAWIFLIYISTGNSLRCWECNSEVSPDCANPSPVSPVRIKERKNPTTRKYVCRIVEYYDKRHKKTFTARSSVDEIDRSNNDACSKTRLAFYAQVEKCRTCSEDLCL